MRFKEGTMVEVLSKKDHSRVWRCAKIVEDDGDGYTVKYYRGPGIPKDGVDEVSADAVRPCPRPAKGTNIFLVGDVVEVLDDGYWRVSVIDEVLEDDYFYIQVVGSLDEFKVNRSSVRERQEWKQNKWVIVDKDSEYQEDLASRMLKKSHVQEIPESNLLPKSLKRSYSDHSSTTKANSKSSQKRRLVDNAVERDAIHGDAYSFTGKVDNPTNQRGNLGKDAMQNFTEKTISSYKANYRNHDDSLELNDCVSTVSSVASCSFTNAISDRLLSHSSTGSRQDSASLCSDADSHSHLVSEEDMCVDQLERGDILRTHELDLYGYRRVLETLYASGPLSWQQEIALTNLRMKLYVSNDEHLSELRRLKSFGELSRHVSLTATILKMMLWLATSFVVFCERGIICNGSFV